MGHTLNTIEKSDLRKSENFMKPNTSHNPDTATPEATTASAEVGMDEMTPGTPEAPLEPPMAFDPLSIVYVPIDEIHEYPKNPRKNEDAIEKVVNSIRQHGMSAPISLDGDHVIIYGHTRYRACRQLGMATVPCIIRTDLSPELVKSLRLADNKLGELSGWDSEKLLKELAELEEAGLDMEQFGFVESMSDEDIDSFFDGIPPEEKEPKKQKVTCPKCGEEFEVEMP